MATGIVRNQDDQTVALIEKWGIPFARALGEFVRAASAEGGMATRSARKDRHVGGKIREPAKGVTTRIITPRGDPEVYARIQKMVGRQKTESAGFVEFDPAVPAKRLGNRLKPLLKARGIRQIDVARRMGVAPSVISRVLKHPERSRLQTLRRIAAAAGIPLSELV